MSKMNPLIIWMMVLAAYSCNDYIEEQDDMKG